MEKELMITEQTTSCLKRCVYEWVECIDKEGGASICRTREDACFEDCHE